MAGKLNNRNKKSIPRKPLSGLCGISASSYPFFSRNPSLNSLFFLLSQPFFSVFLFLFLSLKTSPLPLLLKSLFSIKSSSPSHFPPIRIFLFPCNNPISRDATQVPMVRFPSFHLLFQYIFLNPSFQSQYLVIIFFQSKRRNLISKHATCILRIPFFQ